MEKVSFTNSNNIELSGRLDIPAGKSPRAFAIFAHCFTCSKNLQAVRTISRTLNANGIGVLRFDFTGLGDSQGDFSDSHFGANIQDLKAAADFLADNYLAPQLIIGHSLGGAAAIFAATEIDSIQAVVTVGAPSDPEHVTHLVNESKEEVAAQGKASVSIGGRPFTISEEFFNQLEDCKMDVVLKNMRKPILVMHSPTDDTVGIKNAAEIYQHAWHPKTFVSLDGADHLLTNKADAEYAGQMIGTWVNRYIPIEEAKEKPTSSNEFSVVASLEGEKFLTTLSMGKHSLLADEPADVGGGNLGPTPYDLLMSSLGACTAMTVNMYAERKKLPLEKVIVNLNYEKRHAADCEDCESPSARLDHFDREIEFVGQLTEEQKQKLLEIADKCPVHRTLMSETRIETMLR